MRNHRPPFPQDERSNPLGDGVNVIPSELDREELSIPIDEAASFISKATQVISDLTCNLARSPSGPEILGYCMRDGGYGRERYSSRLSRPRQAQRDSRVCRPTPTPTYLSRVDRNHYVHPRLITGLQYYRFAVSSYLYLCKATILYR